MNRTTGELINANDDNHADKIKLSWMWYLRAGWSGTYKSGYESYGSDILNFEYLVNLFSDVSTTFDVDVMGVYKCRAVI